MKNLSIGLVGKGVAKRLYYSILQEFANVNVEFLSYPHISNDQSCAEPQKLLMGDHRRFDIIFIGTPPFAHWQHLQIALNQSDCVICEKPVGLTKDCPMYFLNKGTNQSKFIGVNYELRYSKLINTLKELIFYKEIREIEIEYYSSARIESNSLPEWYFEKSQGGGIAYSILPHIIDILNYLNFNIASALTVQADITLNLAQIVCILSNSTKITIRINTTSEYSVFCLRFNGPEFSCLVDLVADKVSMNKPGGVVLHKGIDMSSHSSLLWREAFREMSSVLIQSVRIGKIPVGFPNLGDSSKVHEGLETISRHN